MTKRRSVFAWAVCGPDGMPLPASCSLERGFADFWLRNGCKVRRVRITVVRERKKAKATKRRAKR